MLKFFVDCSGSQQSDDLITLGGLIATDRQWRRFEAEWQKALDAADVTHFHATDFFNARRAFDGWDLKGERHRHFARRFSAIVEKQAGPGIAQGLQTRPVREILAPVLQHVIVPHDRVTPMMIGVGKLLQELSELYTPQRKTISVIFDKDNGVGEAIGYFDMLKRKKVTWTLIFESVSSGDSKAILPLQAADLFAYESRRFLIEDIAPTGRSMRKTFKRLLRRERQRVDLIDEACIRESLPHLESYLNSERAR